MEQNRKGKKYEIRVLILKDIYHYRGKVIQEDYHFLTLEDYKLGEITFNKNQIITLRPWGDA